jgi:hypothetical protein
MIGAILAEERVDAVPAKEPVVADIAEEAVAVDAGLPAAEQIIVSPAAEEKIVAVIPVEPVVAIAAMDGIVPRAAMEFVMVVRRSGIARVVIRADELRAKIADGGEPPDYPDRARVVVAANDELVVRRPEKTVSGLSVPSMVLKLGMLIPLCSRMMGASCLPQRRLLLSQADYVATKA